MKNIKGFIFTLDALFSLIVATAGASVLAYSFFSSQGAYQAPQSQAYYLMQSMLQTKVSTIAPSLYTAGNKVNNSYSDYNILQALATLYLTNNGNYADLILNQIYSSQNVGLLINKTYAPDIGTMYFNGTHSYIAIPLSASLNLVNSISVSIWINTNTMGPTSDVIEMAGTSGCGGYAIAISAANRAEFLKQCSPTISSNALQINKWYNIVGTYNGVAFNLYLNGQYQGSYSTNTNFNNLGPLYIANGTDGYFVGSISNIQIYNSTLSQTQAQLIYGAGISGYPIQTSTLSAWWPLNGNSKDLSGFGNNGTAYNVILYTSNALPLSLLNSYSISKATVPIAITSNNTSAIYNVSVVVWR